MKKFYIRENQKITVVFALFLSVTFSNSFAQQKLSNDASNGIVGFAKPAVYSQKVTNDLTPITKSFQPKSGLPGFIQKFSMEKSQLFEQPKIQVQKQSKQEPEFLQGSLPFENGGLKSGSIPATVFCSNSPIGTSDQYVVADDKVLSIAAPGFLANDIDLNGEALSAVAIVTNVTHGSLAAFANGSFTYTPTAGYTGPDGFQYRMKDASGNLSDPVDVAITVLAPANRTPIGSPDVYGALSETALSIPAPGFLANDIDPDGETISAVAIVTNVTNGTLAAFGNGSFTYTPNAGFTGADAFSYRMKDASGNLSDPVQVTINVIEGNRPPIGIDDQYTAVINTALSIAAPGFLTNDVDPDGDVISAVAIVTNVTHGTLAAFGNGSFTYTPAADYTGPDTFSYRMKDAAGHLSDPVNVAINVSAAGTLPVGTPDAYAVPSDKILSIAAPGFLANDIDLNGEALSAVAIVTNVTHGTLAAFANGSFTYTPTAGYTGPDGFQYRMKDASGNLSDPVDVAITVLAPANRTPIGSPDVYGALSETALSIPAPGFLANDIDPDGETISAVAIVTNVTNGTLAAFGNGSFTYTPNAGFTGADTFSYRMKDASGNLSDPIQVTINVIEGNRPPIGIDDQYAAVINTALSIAAPGFLTNDVDLDGDAISAVAIVTNVAHGTLAAFGNGSFTYTPTADYTGPDTFSYRMKDAAGHLSDPVNVAIEVAAPNKPPVAAASNIVTECTGPSGTAVTLDASNSTDPEGGALIYTWYENGSLIAGPSGSATSEVIFTTGSHQVSLKVEDECGNTDPTDISVTVEDTTGPLVNVAFLPLAQANYFEISCSSEDVCSEIASSVSVIRIPELVNPKLSLKNQSGFSLEIDMGKNTVSVKAPDASSFWAKILSNGGLVVNDKQEISAKADKNKYKYSFDAAGNLVSVEGDIIVLRCTATDGNGNTTVNEATLPPSLLKSVTIPNANLNDEAFTGLHRNYPNPFNRMTTIEYRLEKPAYVNIAIFDQTGRMVEELESKQMPEGIHKINWDATMQKPGIYFYRIDYDGNQFSQKMILKR